MNTTNRLQFYDEYLSGRIIYKCKCINISVYVYQICMFTHIHAHVNIWIYDIYAWFIFVHESIYTSPCIWWICYNNTNMQVGMIKKHVILDMNSITADHFRPSGRQINSSLHTATIYVYVCFWTAHDKHRAVVSNNSRPTLISVDVCMVGGSIYMPPLHMLLERYIALHNGDDIGQISFAWNNVKKNIYG